MLVAQDSNGTRILAEDANREMKPFYCPSCKGEVILRRGWEKIEHYAHKAAYTCSWGLGESEEHLSCKMEIYRTLLAQDNVRKCAVERDLKTIRPDVSCYIDDVPVAIEVQCSVLRPEDLYRRTMNYAEKGIYVLWVCPSDFKTSDRDVRNVKQWERWLGALYFGRVYYHMFDARVRAVHYNPVIVDVDGYEDRYGSYPSYQKELKRTKREIHAPEWLDIYSDFSPRDRDEWATKRMSLPKSKIFIDRLAKWW